MAELLPWLRVAAVVGIYLATAVLASLVVRKAGGDLKQMAGRSSRLVLGVGALANLLVLVATLAFLAGIDHRPLSVLGLDLGPRDFLFTLGAAAVTVGGAAVFLVWLDRSGRTDVRMRRQLDRAAATRLLAGVAVLLVVALQEETLYRGYLTVNLLAFGPGVTLGVTTLTFTAIHFLTNRITRAQVASWLLAGLILEGTYLLSGSIWVPVVLHFTTDVTNMLLFAIAGDASLVALSTPISDRQRATFRAVWALAVALLLLSVYGAGLASHWKGWAG